MVQFMLESKDWTTGRWWYHGQQLERHVLGFGESRSIARAPNHGALIGAMRNVYKTWADRRLHGDEDNLTGFCGFLSTEPGRPLRLDGLQWIAAAIKSDIGRSRWYRDRTSDAFMGFLDVVVSDHAHEMAKDTSARAALLELVAHAVFLQLPASLACRILPT
jgi:hypothetical protein